jgi:hypothetical protein
MTRFVSIRVHSWFALLLLSCSAVLAADFPPLVDLPFEDSFEDRGPYAFRAKVHGDEVLFMSGIRGRCVFIGGYGDWIDVPIDERVDVRGGGTLQFWFKRDDWENPYKGGSGWQTVAHFDGMGVNITAPGCPLHEPWSIEGTVEQWSTESERSVTARTAPGFATPHAWHHVAIVYDAQAARARLFVDGIETDRADSAPVPTEKMVNPLRLGTWSETNQAFRGWLDEVKIFAYPRSAGQIAADAAR